MFQNLLKLLVPLSKYNILKIKVIFWYFKRKYVIINPIPKNPKDDSRNPLNYREITITSSVYKLYCYVLNYRLTSWIENNSILCDEQDGFCRIDQLWITLVVLHMY